MRHLHTTPFEMVELKFHIKLPIFVARQWIRHRTANVNEYSGRYSVMKDEFYVPEHEAIHFQNLRNNKEGEKRMFLLSFAESIGDIDFITGKTLRWYEQMLESDIARELARINFRFHCTRSGTGRSTCITFSFLPARYRSACTI